MTAVTVLSGDGIGPEVVAAARQVLDATGVDLQWEAHAVGAAAFAATGSPLPEEARSSIERTRVALKGPVTTPLAGYRSVNLLLRQALDLFVQVRPCRSWPGVARCAPDVDVVVVRSSTEDVYAGVEFAGGSREALSVRAVAESAGHLLPEEVGVSLKYTSSAATARAARFAVEWARANGRRRVTIVHKATNIRCTDGLFLRVARDMAEESGEIEVDDCLVDRAAELLVRRPERFDVLFTMSQYGDILSDLAAGLVGGVGMAPCATHGATTALFEPVHGSAPRRAGQDVVNPVAAVLAGALLLRHLGQDAAATDVEAAVAEVLKTGATTYDVAKPGQAACSTTEMALVLAETVAARARASARRPAATVA